LVRLGSRRFWCRINHRNILPFAIKAIVDQPNWSSYDGNSYDKKEEQFIGRAALESIDAPARVLVGLQGLGRRAGRAGYPVLAEGNVVGEVTSGQPSPTLGYPIALAYVAPEYAEPGTKLDVDLRGKPQPYEVVALPFYKRG